MSSAKMVAILSRGSWVNMHMDIIIPYKNDMVKSGITILMIFAV